MIITKTSILTGVIHTRDINVTQEQMDNFNKGILVQHAFPHVSPDDREFILNGITPEEWDKYMGKEDDDEI